MASGSEVMEEVTEKTDKAKVSVEEGQGDMKEVTEKMDKVPMEKGDKTKVDLAVDLGKVMEEVTEKMDKVKVSMSDEKKIDPDRHCGFCLTLVKGEEVKLCGGCKRRAYCSKGCQSADWVQPDKLATNGRFYGYGQGHKNWCGIPYGEEDLDWKVVPISGKGLGLVALRDLPPLYRVLIEGMQKYPERKDPYHPGVNDLSPPESTDIYEKWKNNSGFGRPEENRIGLRISRVNHACDPNTATMRINSLDVLILFTDKEIKKGEEICQSYFPIVDLRLFKKFPEHLTPTTYQNRLFEAWGIICPPTCLCRTDEGKRLIVLVKICHKLKKECSNLGEKDPPLLKVEKIIGLYEKYGAPPSVMQELYAWARDNASNDFKKAKLYMGKVKGIIQDIVHPNTQELVSNKMGPVPELLQTADASDTDMVSHQIVETKSNVSIDDLKKKAVSVERHCGFCLSPIPFGEVLLCEGCNRRAYCSEECQETDWKTPTDEPSFNGKIYGYGQGHQNWCGLFYGEEDLDWKVVPISGKGLGLVALRDLPPLYRILVEGMQPSPEEDEEEEEAGAGGQGQGQFHPALADLTPADGDILIKFQKNACELKSIGFKVGLRLARVNHNCEGNAAFTDEHTVHVLVLYTDKEIKKGEEILLSYVRGNAFPVMAAGHHNVYKTPEQCREFLSRNWGIVCPLTCPCRDEKKEQLLKQSFDLGEYCEQHFRKKNILKKYERVIKNAKEFGVDPVTLTVIYYTACEYAELGPVKNLSQGRMYWDMSAKLQKAIYHPLTSDASETMVQKLGI